MRQFSEIISSVLSKNILEEFEQHRKLHISWNAIVEEAFVSKTDRSKLNVYNPSKKEKEAMYLIQINIINAHKAADHSSIKYIKNKTLYVESDHQGWIQILQTKQHKIMELINKQFEELRLDAIMFVLSDSEIAKNAPEPAEDLKAAETNEEPSAEESTEDIKMEDAISDIPDENFRELLRKLEKKVQKDKAKTK